ncbi:YhcH/YjgK/YiaL family protein [Chitinophaga parva]|uniref:YhcH/YjgK/YiaL family protein n=1 Tax=Chitinophaga parva TaxID=2169414 RepID=A0A2T7BH38_9BACT|nr:YhcH/YjgK/YiaL family protein [Chitinophaga parva]PUZ25599.1 YhcH/YjgK/YiaL family protein [Chitinophaga parva]
MILDTLANAQRYYGLGPKFVKAFEYLLQTDFSQVEKGRYTIDGDDIFAIVNEYDTIDIAGEQMESHRRYIDVQYVASGVERVGHDFMGDKTPSQAYDAEKDFMLFAEAPAFFTVLGAGQFAVFFPTDLHMPNLSVDDAVKVKKVVVKVGV